MSHSGHRSDTLGACYTKVTGQLHWGHITLRLQVSYTGGTLHLGHRSATLGHVTLRHVALRSLVSYTGGTLHTQVTGQLHWGRVTHSGHRITHQGKLGSVYQGKPYTLGLTDRPSAILQGCLLTWRHFTGLLAYLALFYRAAWFYLAVFYRATCLPGSILQGCLLTWQYFTGLLAYLAVFYRTASLPGGIFQGC